MDAIEAAIIKVTDAAHTLSKDLEQLGKLYVTTAHPERICPNCGYVAGDGEDFQPCGGDGIENRS